MKNKTNNQNILEKMDKAPKIHITGVQGKGMSSAALNIPSKIDPNFSAENIVFSTEEYLKLLKNKDGEK